MAVTVYLGDSFEEVISPRDSSGLNLYIIATADKKKEDLLTISQYNTTNIMSAFRHASNSFV